MFPLVFSSWQKSKLLTLTYAGLMNFERVKSISCCIKLYRVPIHKLKSPLFKQFRGGKIRLTDSFQKCIFCHVLHSNFGGKLWFELVGGWLLIFSIVFTPVYHSLEQFTFRNLQIKIKADLKHNLYNDPTIHTPVLPPFRLVLHLMDFHFLIHLTKLSSIKYFGTG